MTFTSIFFLIGLLPWLIAIYYFFGIKKNKCNMRIILLFCANSMFYIWGGIGSFIYICLYITMIYLLGRILLRIKKRWSITISLIAATAPLVFAKYVIFVIKNINELFNLNIKELSIIVPIGISFFTFEGISFLVDIYKDKIKNVSFLYTYLYLSFFVTITSGPIIRYNEFRDNLETPIFNSNDYFEATERIVIGLCKKVLIADKIAVLANYYFDGTAAGNNYSTIGLWIGSIAYTLQLYFDFSGYSDMAIGIGKLLGFNIRENFDKPYQAGSISEFWKKWHISLTQWFRDYIYIPLGGNRCKVSRHLINMLIVWLLTGIWHGADWTFILWGIGYFVLLVIEKYIPKMQKINTHLLGHIYTLFFVNLLWIPFRADNLTVTGRFLRGMFFGGSGLIEDKAIRFLPFLAFSIMLCFQWDKCLSKIKERNLFIIIKGIVIIALFGLAICAAVNSSYTPYIYGNF